MDLRAENTTSAESGAVLQETVWIWINSPAGSRLISGSEHCVDPTGKAALNSHLAGSTHNGSAWFLDLTASSPRTSPAPSQATFCAVE